MKITILNVNNSINDEMAREYDEKQLLTGDVHISDNASLAKTSHKLIIQSSAVREIFDFIEWDIGERIDSRIEQGGVLLGRRYFDAEKDIHFVIVSKVITADDAIGTTGFLEITQECWRKMHDEKDVYNETTNEEVVIVGWFHTHPNNLSCFMSGTDRNTQNLFFDGENTYSIVINPQRHLIKVFRSRECYPTQAFFIVEDGEKEDSTDEQDQIVV